MARSVHNAPGAVFAAAAGNAAHTSTAAARRAAAERPPEKDLPRIAWSHHFPALFGVQAWIAGALSPTRRPIARVGHAEVCEAKTRAATARFTAEPPSAPRDRYDSGDFINRSCDANVWLAGENTLAARRDIAAGEKLTIDYALFGSDEDDVNPWDCRCGPPPCLGHVTGKDCRHPELQEWNRGHFSPFINRRIERLRAASQRPTAPQGGSRAEDGRDR